MNVEPLMPLQLEQLRSLSYLRGRQRHRDFWVRLRNRGFSDSRLHCLFPEMPTTVGYAATARIRGSDPPMEGPQLLRSRHLVGFFAANPPAARGGHRRCGFQAWSGRLHRRSARQYLLALGCVAVITNGAVRDLPMCARAVCKCSPGNVSVSHAYAHVFDFAGTVEIAGLSVQPGDLIQQTSTACKPFRARLPPGSPRKALEIVQTEKTVDRSSAVPILFPIAKLRERLKELES